MKITPWIKLCKGAVFALTLSYGLTFCHKLKSTDGADKFRPVYHHTSVSRDSANKELLVPVVACDTLGYTFSGSSEPPIIWYAPQDKWVKIITSDKGIRFYDSKTKEDWSYLSSFGDGYGVQPCRFVHSNLVELPVDGDANHKKWALIVNVNPGCYFGGSGTQYFIGDFDGTEFNCDNLPNVTKWLDWGKDYYATAYYSNMNNRAIVIPWMNNSQYCDFLPTRESCNINALPRKLGLYMQDGDIYLSATPIGEIKNLRKENKSIPSFIVDKDYHIESLLSDNDGAYELSLDVLAGKAEIMGLSLFNEKGEKVDIYFNLPERKLVMDRTKSGIVDFDKNSSMREIRTKNQREAASINYINDFALATWAPIQKADRYKLNVFVDRCSVEIFLNGGKIAMTNLVFPTQPYNRMCFYNKGGSFRVDSFSVYRLGL